MSEWMADKQRVAEFEKPKGNPAAFGPPATTVLSPYLKFGCVSVRLFHARILQVHAWECNTHCLIQQPVCLRHVSVKFASAISDTSANPVCCALLSDHHCARDWTSLGKGRPMHTSDLSCLLRLQYQALRMYIRRRCICFCVIEWLKGSPWPLHCWRLALPWNLEAQPLLIRSTFTAAEQSKVAADCWCTTWAAVMVCRIDALLWILSTRALISAD